MPFAVVRPEVRAALEVFKECVSIFCSPTQRLTPTTAPPNKGAYQRQGCTPRIRSRENLRWGRAVPSVTTTTTAWWLKRAVPLSTARPEYTCKSMNVRLRSYLALGRLLSAWYTLLSNNWTSTSSALSSSFFSSLSSVEPGKKQMTVHNIYIHSRQQMAWNLRPFLFSQTWCQAHSPKLKASSYFPVSKYSEISRVYRERKEISTQTQFRRTSHLIN